MIEENLARVSDEGLMSYVQMRYEHVTDKLYNLGSFIYSTRKDFWIYAYQSLKTRRQFLQDQERLVWAGAVYTTSP